MKLTPPFHHHPFSRIVVARAEGYTYAAKVWAVCLVQGPHFLSPRANHDSSDSAIFTSRVRLAPNG
jgi:hypothetical protein